MEQAVPIQKDIVLIGGGHSHVAVLRSFGMNPVPGVRITLISPHYDTPYSGMLPGYLAGHYSFEESHINLLPLCQFAQAQFYRDTVTGLDLQQKKIHCHQHPPVNFDLVSIDTGSTPSINDVPGADDHAIPVKPVDAFLERWNEIETELRTSADGTKRIMIVGGGAGGVELTLSLQHRLETRQDAHITTPVKFTILTASSTILATHNRLVQKSYATILQSRQIDLETSLRVARVEKHQVIGTNGQSYPFDYLLWVTHASAPSWPKAAGLDVDENGFILVDETLRSPSHPFVFAAGDIATMTRYPRPKSGVFAVRQGPPLTKNLRHTITNEPLVPYHPQERFLSLISTGNQYAIASRGPLAVKGHWVWRWKDQIDRRFMERYQRLPQMTPGSRPEKPTPPKPNADALPYSKIRCTGCGSKIGARILSDVMSRLAIHRDPSIEIGLDAPDDAAVFAVPEGQRIVQTVDFFPAFLNDPWLFAQIATVHCLGDIIAMGGEPHSAQIIVTLPYGFDRPLEETLFQTMSGALKVLDEHGTSLIGGHTLEGNQLALGMTINGTISRELPLRKEGLQPGDHLILTKPIGTGMILAALMKGAATSQWIGGAVEQMLRSNASAIPTLQQNNVRSATDLTGFGLVGHLDEVAKASGVNAEIWPTKIPLLSGTQECSNQGIVSSLYPQNHRLSSQLANRDAYKESPFYPPLFDPQTAGGLLFGVDPSKADQCLKELREQGWNHATTIGMVTQATNGSERIRLSD